MRQKRHRKVLKRTKGYFLRKSKTFKNAHEQLMKSGNYAFRDRRAKKRNFRRLWITRINAACGQLDIKYSHLIHGLREKNIDIDRKMLAHLAVEDFAAFEAIAKQAVSK